ncbi:FG-GAP-like repeat-containing protein [Streptomyces abikoensis]|uniref:FG-GAP-like repeat-containing protein n=1 Tax=Streptomyces abikoensis TaxID=97398 RepID=UPI0033BFF086
MGIATSAVAAAVPAHAVVGEEAQPGSYAFTARLTIGDGARGCSAALVEQQWLLTAASCFADNPPQSFKVSAGAPKMKATAAIAGNVTDVVQLVPREGRDLVLAKLAKPVTGVTPVAISRTSPVQGEELHVTGFGRTKDEWVPDAAHHASFTVGPIKDTSIGLTGKEADAVICQGDTGGPAFREVAGRQELVGINSRSWQGGCFGTDPAETRKGALDTRVDDLGSWIAGRLLLGQTLVTAGDYDRDGVADLFSVNSSRELSVSYGRKGGGFDAPRFMSGDWIYDQMVSADFNGDGYLDLIARDPREQPEPPKGPGTNALYIWEGTASGTFKPLRRLTSGWNYTQTVAGDFNGDGKIDLIGIDKDRTPQFRSGKGDGNFTVEASFPMKWNYTGALAGDFAGDGVADLMARQDKSVTPANEYKATLFRWSGVRGDGKTPNFSSKFKMTDGWDYTQTVAGDFNGDGKIDLIAKDDATGSRYMWLLTGDGDGTFSRPSLIADGS